jgi:cytoskeletal protein RodZ
MMIPIVIGIVLVVDGNGKRSNQDPNVSPDENSSTVPEQTVSQSPTNQEKTSLHEKTVTRGETIPPTATVQAAETVPTAETVPATEIISSIETVPPTKTPQPNGSISLGCTVPRADVQQDTGTELCSIILLKRMTPEKEVYIDKTSKYDSEHVDNTNTERDAGEPYYLKVIPGEYIIEIKYPYDDSVKSFQFFVYSNKETILSCRDSLRCYVVNASPTPEASPGGL